MTQEVPDWQLLAESAQGDHDSFRRLVERHQDRVIRHCQRLLGNREAALDAAQEVFLRTYRKASSLEPKGQLYTWLYRVATNHCLNRIRRRKIVRMIGFGSSADEQLPLVEHFADGNPGPEEALATKERWQRTRDALETLPANQRAVVLLTKFEGLSYKETAESLGISVSAVESRLFRAMRHLEKAQEDVRTKVS